MRSIIVVLGTCFLLAACTPRSADRAPAAPAEAVATAPEPASTLAPVTSLAGEWRVAGIDGADFNEPYGLALSGNAQELWWEPRCARVARSYRIDGLTARFAPPIGTPPASSDGPTPPVCAIGLPPRLAEVTRALDAADTIGRTASNGVEISGGGHSLLLFSQ